jgi:hypothetical protein
MNILFQASVLWSYDHELKSKTAISHIGAMFSGIPPVHDHEGTLILTNSSIQITGDEGSIIALADIEEIYAGFDESYPSNFIKNFGAFCKPVRIKASNRFSSRTFYLILNYNYLSGCQNQAFYNMLQEILS